MPITDLSNQAQHFFPLQPKHGIRILLSVASHQMVKVSTWLYTHLPSQVWTSPNALSALWCVCIITSLNKAPKILGSLTAKAKEAQRVYVLKPGLLQLPNQSSSLFLPNYMPPPYDTSKTPGLCHLFTLYTKASLPLVIPNTFPFIHLKCHVSLSLLLSLTCFKLTRALCIILIIQTSVPPLQ